MSNRAEIAASIVLSVRKISLRFGGLKVLSGVDLDVREGSIHALIGPNGAGKTSLLNCVSGLYRPQEGSIHLRSTELTKLAPHDVARAGVTRMFQHIELFPHLSVLDNILVGRHLHVRYRALEALSRFGRMLREEIRHLEAAEEIIDFLDLEGVRSKHVAVLPYGIQKRVELARALATEGRMLLLDEPFSGLSIEESQDMARYVLETLRKFGTTVLLIDHDMQALADIADRITVLDHGQKIAEGEPEVVLNDPAVREAYLGSRAAVSLEHRGVEAAP
jgi:branched-chain amino acid transport system ATP-binding protein